MILEGKNDGTIQRGWFFFSDKVYLVQSIPYTIGNDDQYKMSIYNETSIEFSLLKVFLIHVTLADFRRIFVILRELYVVLC